MKNIIKYSYAVIFSLFVLAACNPQEDSLYSLGTPDSAKDLNVTFTAVATAKSANEILFTNTTDVKFPVKIVWDLGNGSKSSEAQVTGVYPEKGDYNVTLTLYAADGSSASKSQVLHFDNNDFSLMDTPGYRNLTGGNDSINGKTWVFDQYHAGHFGVGPATDANPIWWSAPANAKLGSSLYTQEFTFIQNGTKLIWKNNGYIYTNGAGVSGLGNPAGVISNPGGVGDFDVPYAPNAAYTFILNENDNTLELSDGAFFGHYAGTSKYQILVLSENELYVKCASTVEVGNGWWYRFVPKALNVAPPPVIKDPKAVPLFEDFEGTTPKVIFKAESMGDKSGAVDNPLPLPINTSNKVFRYIKTTEFYSNLSFTADTYKFDLKVQNKIKLKVFIPSFNDYTTDYAVAGSWISNTKLQPQLAVKLQNSEHPSPWETQTEIVQANLTKDKWLELTFDFSNVADRTDYDRIIIQFGAEGHAGPGYFFFDDFSFNQ